jgi:hypothetical protein
VRFRRSRCCRYLFPFGLLTVLIGLVPLAHAVPPDQTWIAGSYDAADLDDAITSALSIAATTKTRRPSAELQWAAGDGARFDPLEPCRDLVASDEPFVVLSDVRRLDSARSPPPDATASAH